MKVYKEKCDVRKLVSETETFIGAKRMVEFLKPLYDNEHKWVIVDDNDSEFELDGTEWKRLF
jgi:tRNA G37 N-methylase Trm5